MPSIARRSRFLPAILPLVLAFAVCGAFAGEQPEDCPVVLDLGTAEASWLSPAETTAVAGGTSCCDPALEPGTNGIPLCFRGAHLLRGRAVALQPQRRNSGLHRLRCDLRSQRRELHRRVELLLRRVQGEPQVQVIG